MTRGQRRALATLAERYVVDPEPGAWPREFARAAPIGIEIGFGMGQAILEWALASPDMNLVGIEIYEPGIGALLAGIEREALSNVRVLWGEAEELLETRFHSASVAETRIWFPDPWPKKRHHKRRLIRPAFAALVADRLAPGGILRVATDWAPYADWIGEVLEAEPSLRRAAAAGERPETRFEARGRRLGHAIRDFHYQRKY
ncbi:MAG: tRNA (guanosine(46)-N7)-methyltransferase TrmB [Gammaproteobacteria bacterium]|nr:tRNA (guanosine(46)-N7)-methyltransferase TrmB [Gammaproteobacteria bacterium]MDE0367374.1 tRNA (guanosine(46)-N7)-methyltransferase TrmB [Gammaproteobacteria bacterium]